MRDTYWLKTPWTEWTKVAKADWIKAERAAGFRPKLSFDDPLFNETCATGGFGSSCGISGSITDGEPPKF